MVLIIRGRLNWLSRAWAKSYSVSRLCIADIGATATHRGERAVALPPGAARRARTRTPGRVDRREEISPTAIHDRRSRAPKASQEITPSPAPGPILDKPSLHPHPPPQGNQRADALGDDGPLFSGSGVCHPQATEYKALISKNDAYDAYDGVRARMRVFLARARTRPMS